LTRNLQLEVPHGKARGNAASGGFSLAFDGMGDSRQKAMHMAHGLKNKE
jgi:hypothetical protein